jgi:two-component system response regulator RegA
MDRKSVRVLVIDDDPSWRRALAVGLPGHGLSVSLAASLSEGGEILRREHVDAVLLDFVWPDGHGLRILPELRELRPAAALLVCTAHGSIAAAVTAMWGGARDFLIRPTTAEHVATSIRSALQAGPRPALRAALPASAMPLDRVHWEHIQRVLIESDWNVSRAARRLGIHRQSLQRKLRKLPVLREPAAGTAEAGRPRRAAGRAGWR